MEETGALEINTHRFGKLSVQADRVISFPKGILGFNQYHDFILFPHRENSPFFWLQSIEDGGLAFVAMNPKLVCGDFCFDLDDQAVEDLGTTDAADLEVLCIVTVPPEHPEAMTINLLGPIIINAHKRLAVQVVLNSEQYSHRHPVLKPQTASAKPA